MLDVVLDSWDRQCRIVDNLFDLIDDGLKVQRPSEDGMPIVEQFAHIHNTRRFWLANVSPEHIEGYGRSYVQVGEEDWEPLQDLAELRELLRRSGEAVRDATEEGLKSGRTPFGGYDHPVLFLQHMLWHEGYHFALIVLALRLAGAEPSEEWEEAHVWGLWRVEG
jgi:uncharacterized damage-inducible protein DinB